jgi:hypothetical protein
MINTLLAIGLTYTGWILYASFYYLRTNTLNGFLNIKKIIASSIIMILLSILLVNVPEAVAVIKMISGLEIDIENSKVGFLTLGFAMAGVVSSKIHKTKDNA